jgi:long-chain fatty acid transport protein
MKRIHFRLNLWRRIHRACNSLPHNLGGGKMKRALRTLMFTLLGLAFISTTVFAAGVDLTGVGARATALGGNYRAVANDWSAMFWNPAGLAFSQGLKAGVSVELVTPTVGYTAGPSLLNGQFSGTSATEVKNEPKTFVIPAAGIYLSTGKLALGLGFWAPFGLGAKWDLLNTSAYNKSYPVFDLEDNLQVIDIHPTLAYKVSEKLSIGVGASVILADIMIRKPNFTPNPFMYNRDLLTVLNANPATKAVMDQVGAGTNAFKPPYDHLITEGTLDGNGTGFGFNAGLMFKPMETFSIGLSVKYYGNVALEGTVKSKTYFATIPAAHAGLGNLKPVFDQMLALGKIDQQSYGVLLNYYSGATLDRGTQDIKADLPLPLNAGIGFAYTGIQKLLISADIAWTQWSVWDVIDIKNKEDESVYTNLTENWKDGVRWGLGLEYNLLPELVLRGSYYNEPSAAVAETMAPTIPDVGARNTVNFGIEVPVGPMRLHASVEKIFVKDLTVDKWILTPDNKGYANWAGTYTMSDLNFMLGCDYAF